MQRCLKCILTITIVLAVFRLHDRIEAAEFLRWKNGDSLSGKLLESNSGKIRWQSPYFSDRLGIDIGVLDSIVFSKVAESTQGTFRIGTISGDVWTADIIDSDANTFLFANKRFGKFRVNRSSIYSLEGQEHHGEYPKQDGPLIKLDIHKPTRAKLTSFMELNGPNGLKLV